MTTDLMPPAQRVEHLERFLDRVESGAQRLADGGAIHRDTLLRFLDAMSDVLDVEVQHLREATHDLSA